jgi:hypothetical protein
MQEDGLLVNGIPIKIHTMAEKAKIVHNLEYCLDTYNNWITQKMPNYAIEYKPAEISEIARIENKSWKFGDVDTSALLTYNDIDNTTLNKSDLKQ